MTSTGRHLYAPRRGVCRLPVRVDRAPDASARAGAGPQPGQASAPGRVAASSFEHVDVVLARGAGHAHLARPVARHVRVEATLGSVPARCATSSASARVAPAVSSGCSIPGRPRTRSTPTQRARSRGRRRPPPRPAGRPRRPGARSRTSGARRRPRPRDVDPAGREAGQDVGAHERHGVDDPQPGEPVARPLVARVRPGEVAGRLGESVGAARRVAHDRQLGLARGDPQRVHDLAGHGGRAVGQALRRPRGAAAQPADPVGDHEPDARPLAQRPERGLGPDRAARAVPAARARGQARPGGREELAHARREQHRARGGGAAVGHDGRGPRRGPGPGRSASTRGTTSVPTTPRATSDATRTSGVGSASTTPSAARRPVTTVPSARRRPLPALHEPRLRPRAVALHDDARVDAHGTRLDAQRVRGARRDALVGVLPLELAPLGGGAAAISLSSAIRWRGVVVTVREGSPARSTRTRRSGRRAPRRPRPPTTRP